MIPIRTCIDKQSKNENKIIANCAALMVKQNGAEVEFTCNIYAIVLIGDS